MAIAVLGDIHANLAALRAVLEATDDLPIERIFFVGDLVGYNASPNECLDAFRERGVVGISGNHDRYTVGQEMTDVRDTTVEAVKYTRGAIGDEGIAFLRDLPDQRLVDERYLLVHGSLLDRDEYMLSPWVIKENLRALRTEYIGIEVCFFGHSHFPAVLRSGRIDMQFPVTRTVKLDPLRQYFVNPGSIGQPRDSVPLASFAVFEPERHTVTITRVAYDVEDSYRRVLDAGLGRHLAERLLVGR